MMISSGRHCNKTVIVLIYQQTSTGILFLRGASEAMSFDSRQQFRAPGGTRKIGYLSGVPGPEANTSGNPKRVKFRPMFARLGGRMFCTCVRLPYYLHSTTFTLHS